MSTSTYIPGLYCPFCGARRFPSRNAAIRRRRALRRKFRRAFSPEDGPPPVLAVYACPSHGGAHHVGPVFRSGVNLNDPATYA